MLGISVYFKDYDASYLKEAARLGTEYVFTSLQLQEDDASTIKDKLLMIQEDCLQNHLKLIVDISPETKKILGVYDYEELKQFGVEVVRLDYGFEDIQDIVKLSKSYQIILNASTLDVEFLETLRQTGIDMSTITAMHNFYPQRYTALGNKEFIEKNKWIKEYGLRVMAFVCGDDTYRYPFYEGLPTLEEHRGVNPYIAMLQMIEEYYVDDVIVGDSKAKLSSLTRMSKLYQKIITIPVSMEASYLALLKDLYTIRKDSSEQLVRLTVPRIRGNEAYHCIKRIAGSIVLLNDRYQRYSGEVQIMKKELPFDNRCNVIGYIHPEYIGLLPYMHSQYKIHMVDVSYDEF